LFIKHLTKNTKNIRSYLINFFQTLLEVTYYKKTKMHNHIADMKTDCFQDLSMIQCMPGEFNHIPKKPIK